MSWTRFLPAKGESDRPVSDEPIGYAGLWSSSVVFGLLWGLGAFLLIGAFMGFDYFSVRNQTTETVSIVSIEPSGTLELCGRRALSPDTPGERTTYLSANPPPGLPAEFAITHCPWDEVAGDTLEVRRTGTSADDFYPDPIDSPGKWLGMAGVVGLFGAVFMTVVGLVNGVWEVRAERKAQARRRLKREKKKQKQKAGDAPDPSVD